MTQFDKTARAEMLIRRPIQMVFEAFIDPTITSKFWFTIGSGKLIENTKVSWEWEMYNLIIPVYVKQIEPQKSIIIEWGEGKTKSVVAWEFKSLSDDKTFVTITNSDFQSRGDELISQVIDSTSGFALVIAGAKAWLEHEICLNLIDDKHPSELL